MSLYLTDVSCPSCKDSVVTGSLILAGQGMRQHLDCKVTAMKSFMFKMRRRTNNKSPVVPRPCPTQLARFQTADPDLTLTGATQGAPNQERRLSDSPACLGPSGNHLSCTPPLTGISNTLWKWLQGAGSSLLLPTFFFVLLLDVFLT